MACRECITFHRDLNESRDKHAAETSEVSKQPFNPVVKYSLLLKRSRCPLVSVSAPIAMTNIIENPFTVDMQNGPYV